MKITPRGWKTLQFEPHRGLNNFLGPKLVILDRLIFFSFFECLPVKYMVGSCLGAVWAEGWVPLGVTGSAYSEEPLFVFPMAIESKLS